MEDPSKPRSIRLADYLIEQKVGSDPKAQAAIFSKILSGEIEAFLTVHPAPPHVGASAVTILRYANSELREVAASSHEGTKAELRKAVLGRVPDWAVLDRLSVRVPHGVSARKAMAKPMQREAAHKANILDAIRTLGYIPTSLPPDEAGKRGMRSRVRHHLHDEGIPTKAFDKAWQALRDDDLIK